MKTFESVEKDILVCNLGRTRFADVWDLQQQLFQLRVDGKIPNVLLLTEHENVYTIGKTGRDDHLLAPREFLREKDAEVFNIDRGGDITYHGPGQLVVYPILNLQDFYLDVHRYLRDLEEVIILALQPYGVRGERDPQYTGVWVGGKKIAAIGVKVSRWVTMHGLAINVTTDLSYFDWIIPCGIKDRAVTSLERVLLEQKSLSGIGIHMDKFAGCVLRSFGVVFDLHLHWITPKALRSLIEPIVSEEETCLH